MKWDSIAAFTVSIGTFWAAAKVWIAKIKPYIVPLINGAEEEYKKAMEDGIVTSAEKKAMVMAGIAELEKDGKIKLNFITRWLIGKVVDKIAQKLPPVVKIPGKFVLPDDYNKPTMQ